MKVDVLSCGPSVAHYTRGDADLVIGVHRAGILHECDWVCVLDTPWGRIFPPGEQLKGSPMVFRSAYAKGQDGVALALETGIQ